MSVVELYKDGTIPFLFQKGLISSSVPIYIEYYMKFSMYRKAGKNYRQSVLLLSKEFKVSSTTIKKAIRTIGNSLH